MTSKRIGRPPRSKRAALARLEIRMTSDEDRRWNAAAKRLHKGNLSALIRAAVEKYIRP